MAHRVLAAALLLLAGCPSPELQECTLHCGPGNACPAAYHAVCGTDTYCHAEDKVNQLCTATGDGGSDGAADAAPPDQRLVDATGDMTAKRANHKAVLLNDRTVLVTGGYYTFAYSPHGTVIFAYLATAETYDPASRVFSATGSMTTPRAYHTATILKDGTVLVTGGDNGSGPLATADVYQ